MIAPNKAFLAACERMAERLRQGKDTLGIDKDYLLTKLNNKVTAGDFTQDDVKVIVDDLNSLK